MPEDEGTVLGLTNIGVIDTKLGETDLVEKYSELNDTEIGDTGAELEMITELDVTKF